MKTIDRNSLSSIEIPLLTLQGTAAVLCAAAGAPLFFFIFQFASAIYILHFYHKTAVKINDREFYFTVSLIASLPFLWYPLSGITRNLITKNDSRSQSGSATIEKELTEHINISENTDINFKPGRCFRPELAADAIPIIDLLSGDNLEIKRKSIVVLHKLKTTKSIALLKKALSDSNVEIKFMAASALLNIENDFKERIKNMEEEITVSENEGYGKIYELHYNLAVLISKYLTSGLTDGIEGKRLAGRIHELLNSAISENENYIEARTLLAEEYYKKAMYGEALQIVESIINGPRISECGETIKISLITLLCEINYRLGDIEKLRKACGRIQKYLTADILKKRPELIDFEKSVRYFGGEANTEPYNE